MRGTPPPKSQDPRSCNLIGTSVPGITSTHVSLVTEILDPCPIGRHNHRSYKLRTYEYLAGNSTPNLTSTYHVDIKTLDNVYTPTPPTVEEDPPPIPMTNRVTTFDDHRRLLVQRPQTWILVIPLFYVSQTLTKTLTIRGIVITDVLIRRLIRQPLVPSWTTHRL